MCPSIRMDRISPQKALAALEDNFDNSWYHACPSSSSNNCLNYTVPIGCDLNRQDSFGRSPLHVAAAVDYEAVTEFLLEKNANIDARTYGELQAPIHYAAKNGATRSLKMLLSFDAKIDTLDAKQRTPLQVSFVVLTKNLYLRLQRCSGRDAQAKERTTPYTCRLLPLTPQRGDAGKSCNRTKMLVSIRGHLQQHHSCAPPPPPPFRQNSS